MSDTKAEPLVDIIAQFNAVQCAAERLGVRPCDVAAGIVDDAVAFNDKHRDGWKLAEHVTLLASRYGTLRGTGT